MRYLILTILLLCVVLLYGCAALYIAPVVPPQGGMFSFISAPLDTNVSDTEIGSKTGSSSAHSLLGMIAFGDCSIDAASREGRLTKINHADYKFVNVLGVYTRFTTVVYGE